MPLTDPTRPPSRELLLLELRAIWELTAFFASYPMLRMAARGDGHPVLVLPGLAASDLSTRPLRRYLSDQGWSAHGWKLGQNHGPRPGAEERMQQRLAELFARHERKVSVIGWSLGGIFARELARRFPADVRQVITLASPFRAPSASSVARFYRRGRRNGTRPEPRAPLGAPLSVPSSSLYSRSDGVVAWRSCLQDEGPLAENIEVRSSHCGMGHHPGALLVIADRLAQPEGAWRPYTPPALPWRAALGL